MQLSDLRNSHKLALGGGVVLLVASFLPWYSVSGFGQSASVNGWGAGFWAWFGILLGLVGVIVLGLKLFDVTALQIGPVAAEPLSVVLTGLSAVFILLRLLTQTSFLSFGLFIGLAAAVVAAVGAWQAMREEGLSLPIDEVKQRLQSAGGSGGASGGGASGGGAGGGAGGASGGSSPPGGSPGTTGSDGTTGSSEPRDDG